MKKSLITVLTDFGEADHYVASMKGRILDICPDVTIIDVTHNVPPQNIQAGAYLLEQYWYDFAPGSIHLCVIDPGVGSARNPLAIQYEERFLSVRTMA
jgi:S-adenosylmethionine hydrolase